MARPNTVWAYNNGITDAEWSTAPNEGGDWMVIDLVSDRIMFLDSQQQDGDSATGPIYPVIIPDSGEIEAPKTFVNDASLGLLKQVPLAGTASGGQSGGDTRYVFAIYFSGATAGIPYLEAWDDNTHQTASDQFLGGGTPSNSTLRAIATTNASPGSATWAGIPLSGTDSRVELDTAALSGARTLYFNIKQVIPSTLVPEENSSIVLTLRFLYS